MIRKYTPAAPIPVQPGDSFAQVVNTIQQWRAGNLVATHDLAAMPSALLTQPEFRGTDHIDAFYAPDYGTTGGGEMIWIEIDSVTHSQTGAITVSYTGSVSGSGNSNGWNSLSDVQLAVQGPININSEEGVLLLHMARWLALDADLNDEELVLGKRLTVDVSALSIITVS